MKVEYWRPVVGFEGYFVSNLGRVKSSVRRKERILSQFLTPSGYCAVGLGRYHDQQRVSILVAKAFPEICGKWFEGAQVHHKNFDKLDNRPENLVVLSASEHAKLHDLDGTRNQHISESKSKEVLQYTLDGRFLKKWKSAKETRVAHVPDVCRGVRKTAGGFIWCYASSASS